MELRPRINTSIQNEGAVVFHDETRFGLRRICIASFFKYPDIELWITLLEAESVPLLFRYTEKLTLNALFVGYLWIFYKIGR